MVTDQHGRKRIRVLGEGDYLENYGAVWYYTKLNDDNSFSYDKDPATKPDTDGNWPLRKDGWGHGRAYLPTTGQTRKAWDTMRRPASEDAIYGYEMIPRDMQ